MEPLYKKGLFVDDIVKGARDKSIPVDSLFAVGEKKLLTTKYGSLYLHLVLIDKTGSIKAKIWEDANIPFDSVPAEGVVFVSGQAECFNNTVQVIVDTIRPVETKDINPSDFVPASDKDPEVLIGELKKLLEPAFSSTFNSILYEFFKNAALIEDFKKAPGAVKVHHAYIGGLLEHTLGVVKLCDFICDLYPFLDRPILLTGALFHDIGKIREYRYDWKIDYTDEGRLIGHSVLGVQIVDELIRSTRAFPEEMAMVLRHMILSHHGEIETGAVQLPMTREAMALHFADNLDARMASLNQIYGESNPGDRWTAYQNLYSRRFFLAFSGTEGFPEEISRPESTRVTQKTIEDFIRSRAVRSDD